MRLVLLQIQLHTDPEDCPRLCRPCIVCTYLYNLYKGVPLWGCDTHRQDAWKGIKTLGTRYGAKLEKQSKYGETQQF